MINIRSQEAGAKMNFAEEFDMLLGGIIEIEKAEKKANERRWKANFRKRIRRIEEVMYLYCIDRQVEFADLSEANQCRIFETASDIASEIDGLIITDHDYNKGLFKAIIKNDEERRRKERKQNWTS